MKKVLAILFVCMTFFFAGQVKSDELMDITRAAGYEVDEINRPKASIIIDGETGDIIWQDNVDAVRDPASMSKVMTLYLVYEEIAKGTISEETVITATATDQAISGIYAISNNKIVAGVDYTIGELVTMTAVPSSNAATIMLANYLSDGDPDAFLDRMNAKAQELGMTNTKWNNASGAAAEAFEGYYNPTRYDNSLANQTTARDLATMVYNFVKNYPAILEHTKDAVVTVKAGTPYEETFTTYNYSLPDAEFGIEGVNGLKTGSSPRGGFNYIATVDRGGQKVISVIMGVGDWSDQDGEYYRHPFGNALIEKAYADYDYKLLLEAGEHEINGKKYSLSQDFYGTLAKGEEAVFAVENNQLSLVNHLEPLNSLVSNTVQVEEVADNVVSAAKKVAANPSDGQAWYTLLLDKGLLLLPLVFLLIFLIALERKMRRKRKAKLRESQSESYSRRKRN